MGMGMSVGVGVSGVLVDFRVVGRLMFLRCRS